MKNYLVIFFLILFIIPLTFKNISAFDYEIDDTLDGFGWSMGLSLNEDRIYVADGIHNEILIFDKLENIFLKRISLQEKTCSGHIHGIEIMFDKIFVVKENQNCIAIFDLDGKFLYEFGKKGVEQGEFNGVLGIKVSENQIFVTDSGNNRIQVFDLDGEIIGTINENFNVPHQISLDENKIYVLDTYNSQVKIFSILYQTANISTIMNNELEFNKEFSEMNDSVVLLIIMLLIIIIIVLFMIFLRKKLV